MTFFKRFFPKKKISVSTDMLENSLPEKVNGVTKRATLRPAVLHSFLERDHWQAGFNQAMYMPSVERRNSAIKKLSADYRMALQQAVQSTEADAENHAHECLRMNGLSEVLDLQMERRTRELNALVNTLQLQLALSIDEEGWIAPVLAAYRDGFLVGTLKYARENEMLGGITANI